MGDGQDGDCFRISWRAPCAVVIWSKSEIGESGHILPPSRFVDSATPRHRPLGHVPDPEAPTTDMRALEAGVFPARLPKSKFAIRMLGRIPKFPGMAAGFDKDARVPSLLAMGFGLPNRHCHAASAGGQSEPPGVPLVSANAADQRPDSTAAGMKTRRPDWRAPVR